MNRALGLLFILAALVLPIACSNDEGTDTAEDRAGGSSEAGQQPDDGDGGEPVVVEIVSGSAARGDVSGEATVIGDERELDRYLRQFSNETFTSDVTAAIEAHDFADGRVPGLAVIEISCDTPPSATVTQEGSRFLVTPAKVADPLPECYVPVTSVAVLDLPR